MVAAGKAFAVEVLQQALARSMDVPEDVKRVDVTVHRPVGSATDRTYLYNVSTVAVLYCARPDFRVSFLSPFAM